ncbi:hypothetical protein P1J78_07600 [Psychromarinibacter sp. C21-152]|uniref:Uncharacterized protein n=1 Tax=Psychromarinibacter sediminicola TaxID=3033385 RepID=A0AAE3NQI1_9RHOB|nr:hypothetical protein [Psychromarinibacter sediminicola]MDF0600589.1 hypothetical protein [Psychromarinibacter sediminicola]
MTQSDAGGWRLSLISVIVSAAAFYLLQDTAYDIAGGHFDYPLDDPYIHLAIAEQIRAGGYGVNSSEPAAAASSPLYPLLLVPFAGTEWHRYMPLFWNVSGLLLAAALWGRILWAAGYGRGVVGLLFAVAAPVCFNLVGLAFVGMEHMLHLAASLAVVLGLLTFADTRRITAPLVLGILFAPLLRFEGLALAILAAGMVSISGRWRAGVSLLGLAILPALLFAAFLMSMDLGPLPSSVRVKLTPPPDAEVTGVFDFLMLKLTNAFTERHELILTLLLVVTGIFTAIRSLRTSARGRIILPVIAGAGLAHLLFGRFGWMDRYEVYILLVMAAGLLAVAAVGPASRWWPALVGAPMLFAAALYVPFVVVIYPLAPRAIHVQQGQMARFAKQFLEEPVAVNDLGYVSWQNPNYVQDIWGLGNAEAYELRVKQGGPPGWVDRLVDNQGVRFAMVYDSWVLPEDIGDDWRLLGQLTTAVSTFYLGGHIVNFYLVDPQAEAAPFMDKIGRWAEDLPPGARFRFTSDDVDLAGEAG